MLPSYHPLDGPPGLPWRLARPHLHGLPAWLASLIIRALNSLVITPRRTLSPRDRFVLIASDGVWDVIDDDQVYSHMK